MRAKRFVVCGLGVVLATLRMFADTPDLRLIEAVKNGDTAAVRALLKQRIDVNATQGDGATALHWAAYRDDLESADLLIRAGAKVNAVNDVRATPLMMASVTGNPLVIGRLLKAGANPNLALESGETPLMTASRTASAEGVKLLLAYGADPNARESWRGQTALMWAVSRKHPDVVRTLIEAGADVHARTKAWYELTNPSGSEDGTGVAWIEQGGFTPLLFAAREGDVECAQVLVANGANVNDAAASGTSALVVSVHSGNPDVAAFLLEKGADPNSASAGYSALHLAILRNDAEVVKNLLAHRANPNILLERPTAGRRSSPELELRPAVVGATPFWLAARYGEPQIMQLLAAAGANPLFVKTFTVPDIVQPSEVNGRPVPEPAGMTSIMAALSAESVRRRLLSAGVPNAEEQAVLEAVTLAARLGVDVNAADEDGETALHRAARLRFNSVVEFLAGNAAKLEPKNKLGQTPLMIATAAGAGSGRGGGGQPAAGQAGGRGSVISTADLLRKLGATQ